MTETALQRALLLWPCKIKTKLHQWCGTKSKPITVHSAINPWEEGRRLRPLEMSKRCPSTFWQVTDMISLMFLQLGNELLIHVWEDSPHTNTILPKICCSKLSVHAIYPVSIELHSNLLTSSTLANCSYTDLADDITNVWIVQCVPFRIIQYSNFSAAGLASSCYIFIVRTYAAAVAGQFYSLLTCQSLSALIAGSFQSELLKSYSHL